MVTRRDSIQHHKYSNSQKFTVGLHFVHKHLGTFPKCCKFASSLKQLCRLSFIRPRCSTPLPPLRKELKSLLLQVGFLLFYGQIVFPPATFLPCKWSVCKFGDELSGNTAGSLFNLISLMNSGAVSLRSRHAQAPGSSEVHSSTVP